MEPLYKRIWTSVKTYFGTSSSNDVGFDYKKTDTSLRSDFKIGKSSLEKKISDNYKSRPSSIDSGIDDINMISAPILFNTDNTLGNNYHDSSHDYFHGSGGDFGGGGSSGGWDSSSDFGGFDSGGDCGGGCGD